MMPSLPTFLAIPASATPSKFVGKNYFSAHFFGLLLAFILLFSIEAKSQCPPAGTPFLGDFCTEAPLFCNGLDGYCGTLNIINNQQFFPGCNASTLNNDDWLAFVAGSNEISILITPSNCQVTNGQSGMQAGIYASCTTDAKALQCDCTENPFILSSNNYTVGDVYFLVLDGCAGDICDYQIDMISGFTGCQPTINGPTPVCLGDTVTYALVGIESSASIEWLPIPNASIMGNGNTAEVVWTSYADSTAVCALVTANGQTSQQVCLDVVLIQPSTTTQGPCSSCDSLQADAGAIRITCLVTSLDTIIWGATNIPTSFASFQWLLNGNVISTTQSVHVNAPGQYILKVTNTLNGCVASDIMEVIIDFVAPTALAGEDITLTCDFPSVSLDGTASSIGPQFQYNWTGPGTIIDPNSLTPTVNTPGTYILTVLNTENGCVSSDFVIVEADFEEPTADAGPDMSIEPCSSPTANLDGSASSSGPAFFYVWEGPGGFIDFNQNPTVSEPGVYTLTVINEENGCSATDEVDVILLFVELQFPIVTTPDSCHTNSGTATIITGDPSYPVTWSNGETTTTITGLAAGTYYAYVTVGFCQFSSSAVVDSLACTGVEEVFKDVSVTVLPNPNNGQFSLLLDLASPAALSLEMVDVQGRVVANLQAMKTFDMGQHRLDFQHTWLPSGTYYLMIKNEKGKMGLKMEVVR